MNDYAQGSRLNYLFSGVGSEKQQSPPLTKPHLKFDINSSGKSPQKTDKKQINVKNLRLF